MPLQTHPISSSFSLACQLGYELCVKCLTCHAVSMHSFPCLGLFPLALQRLANTASAAPSVLRSTAVCLHVSGWRCEGKLWRYVLSDLMLWTAVCCHGVPTVPGFCQEDYGEVPSAGKLGTVQRASASKGVPGSLCFSAAPYPPIHGRWEEQPSRPSGHHSTLKLI